MFYNKMWKGSTILINNKLLFFNPKIEKLANSYLVYLVKEINRNSFIHKWQCWPVNFLIHLVKEIIKSSLFFCGGEIIKSSLVHLITKYFLFILPKSRVPKQKWSFIVATNIHSNPRNRGTYFNFICVSSCRLKFQPATKITTQQQGISRSRFFFF